MSSKAHPVVAIQQAKKLFEFASPVVRNNGNPLTYEKIESEIKEKCAEFDAIVNATELGSLSAKKHEKPDELKHQFEHDSAQRARKHIILSAFDGNFKTKYEDDLDNVTSTDELYAILRELIGCPTKAEIVKKMKTQLHQLERRTELEEKFSTYLGRIKKLAEKITTKADTITYLVEEKFVSSLSARELDFIQLQMVGDINDHTAQQVAKLLDEKRQNKRNGTIASVNASDRKLDAMNEKLHSYDEMFAKLMESQLKVEKLTVELNRRQGLQENETQRLYRDLTQNTRQGRNDVFEVNRPGNERIPWEPREEWQKQWKLNTAGYPVRCLECGLRGHYQEDCRGTKRICETCGRIGHTKVAGNYHSKNEQRAQTGNQ